MALFGEHLSASRLRGKGLGVTQTCGYSGRPGDANAVGRARAQKQCSRLLSRIGDGARSREVESQPWLGGRPSSQLRSMEVLAAPVVHDVDSEALKLMAGGQHEALTAAPRESHLAENLVASEVVKGGLGLIGFDLGSSGFQSGFDWV